MPDREPSPRPEALTSDEATVLAEICRLLDAAYDHYFTTSDGYCKTGEGGVMVHLGTHDERSGAAARPLAVYITSSVLGSSSRTRFGPLDDQLEAVRDWYADELATVRPTPCDPWNPPVVDAELRRTLRAEAVRDFEYRRAEAR